MSAILALQVEIELIKRAYWQSQQQLSQLLIERLIEHERILRSPQVDSSDNTGAEES